MKKTYHPAAIFLSEKQLIVAMALLFVVFGVRAQHKKDSLAFKKKVLQSTEVDLLTSYYAQDGENAAVTGGIGSEKLDDSATEITVSVPLNDDDVLTIDGTVSAYTSASSSNLNPFTGASQGGDDDDEGGDDDRPANRESRSANITGTPWAASSGASRSDVWSHGTLSYRHNSDDRNRIWGGHVSASYEFDYYSFGLGADHTWLFNDQNTEISLKLNMFLDKWHPAYPTEIKTYVETGGSLYDGFFSGVPIYDQFGNSINKSSPYAWKPFNTHLISNKHRNTYTGSVSFSQILTPRMQISLFADIVQQRGWLSNPMQRVYFKDRPNFYIGNRNDISRYTSPSNQGVFQLADDIERLPHVRYKFPMGIRLHYYINDFLVLRTYYRYYFDTWGIKSHTFDIEVPVKISSKFTLYPDFRYYTQTQSYYFAPYETHLSTEQYYTSDYDLSAFNARKYGLRLRYTDVFTRNNLWFLGLKQVDLRFSHYQRNSLFHFNIVSLGFKFVTK